MNDPCFCAVIKALLLELKFTKLQSYLHNIPMIETTILLSRHEWFIPVFIEIVLKNINAYNGRDVAFGMTLISIWLKQVDHLPTNFDFKSFRPVLSVLDEQFDHDLGCCRTLELLYHNLHKVPLNKRISLFEILCSRNNTMFYRLFFHWSYNVR